jgi:hypothetical protein
MVELYLQSHTRFNQLIKHRDNFSFLITNLVLHMMLMEIYNKTKAIYLMGYSPSIWVEGRKINLLQVESFYLQPKLLLFGLLF